MNSKALLLAAAAGFGLAACGDFERGKPIPVAAAPTDDGAPDDATSPTSGKPITDTTGGGDGATGLSFAADVHPILIDKCTQCHGPNNSTAYKLTGEAETDLATVLALVNTGAPADSLLLKKGSGSTSHGGGAVIEVESPEYETIVQWLVDGAKP